MRIEVREAERDTPCFVCNSRYNVTVIALHSQLKGTDKTPMCRSCMLQLLRVIIKNLPDEEEEEQE